MTATNGFAQLLAALIMIAATVALTVYSPLCVVAQEFSCTITAPRPARAFFPGESIYLTVTATGPQQQATYTIFDYQGRRRIVNTLQVGNGQPRNLAIPFRMPTGIYYLTLNFATGQQVNDAFCVIPRPDDEAGEYGIFGFHLGNPSEQLVAALAQAGVRLVRDDMDWVNSEPTQVRDSVDSNPWLHSRMGKNETGKRYRASGGSRPYMGAGGNDSLGWFRPAYG